LSAWLIWEIVRGNLAVIDTTLLGKECLKSQESNNYKKNRNSIKGNIKNTRKRYLTNTNLYSFDPSKFFANRYFQEENFLSIFDIFPERSEGFDFFVGNPPYSAFQDPQYKYIRQVLFKSIEDGTKGNTYAFFIEAMWNFTKRKNAKAALVVPLSISYSMDKSIKKLRNLIEASNWHFRFSFYDRTPDSLFGDAVKTRSCIIELHKSQNTKTIIETSGIIRWNSRNRSSLFKNLKFTTLSSHSIKEFIPKLSSSMERVVYQNLVNNPKKLGSIWKTVSPNVLSNLDVNASPVYYYNVAYNWISCFRKIPADKDGNLVLTNSLRAVVCRNERESDFLFAVLTSRLVYWLWRVEGDGFHVTQSFLNRIPIHPSQFHQRALKRLSNLSDMLWNDLLKNSIISINSGKKTINYSPKNSSSLIDQIDEEIIASLNIPREFGEYLRDYVQENIIVGRQDEITKRGT
ncbi:MAG TPA: hypothetical protein DDY18_05430, partial [Flavobacterium sp.]|nr:hypothetical protein [Flavobacterium sp.]